MNKLALQAEALSRQIYASLPWGYRVAQVLLKLSFGSQETFGRFVYAKFLQAGVSGLPDIKGAPALNFQKEVQGPRGESKLPHGYGTEFARKVWAIGLKKFRDPEIVEDAVSTVSMKLVSGQMRVEEGCDLQKAEGFIIKAFLNVGIDLIRHRKHGPGQMPVDEDGHEIDLADPNNFSDLGDALPPGTIRQIVNDLEQLNPRTAEWFVAQLEGTSMRELAQRWNVTPNTITNLLDDYLPRIKKIVYRHLEG